MAVVVAGRAALRVGRAAVRVGRVEQVAANIRHFHTGSQLNFLSHPRKINIRNKLGEVKRDSRMAIRFDGRVALVTGAGGGLGRSYALLLASRGAKVVVNDLGGSRSGEGGDARPADRVVEEIRQLGGVAVPNYDSVEDGEKLVSTALDNFGRIDVVINNAGILRDRSFARMTDNDWDLIHRVHLRGAYKVTRAAWPHMRAANYGRIVITSSVAGVYGNFGQANYSAAKLGLVGLAKTLAVEGERAGITCNVILPMAASRLTQDILPPDVFDSLSPDHIAPVVGWLCHEDCADTGTVIEAAGGWAGSYRWERSIGQLLLDPASRAVSLETVRANWGAVTDMTVTERPETNQQATMDLVARIQEGLVLPPAAAEGGSPGSSSSGPSGPLSAVGFVSAPKEFTYTSRDLILYALGLGVSTRDLHGLRYIYEGHDQFAALATFGVLPALAGMDDLVTGRVPGLEIDLTKVLHGEQYIEILRPVPTEGRLTSVFRVQDILDKGSGMVLLVEVETRTEAGDLVFRTQVVTFVVGAGGFGGPRTSPHSVSPAALPDNRPPDASSAFTTSVDQAALYRLSGDYNPLHVDPEFAAMGGFSTPILHGLCSFGIAVRQIAERYADGDTERVKAVKARFSKPVLPGQTIVTEMWEEGQERILFRSRVRETGDICITGGWVKLDRSTSKL